MRVEHLLDFAFANRANALFHYLATLEEQQRGDAADVVPHRGAAVGVHIQLADLALPAYSPATTSMVGAICRHGPHHSAQKSTRTGTSERSTSWSNVASEKFSVLSPAISSPDFNLSIRIPRGPKDSTGQHAPVQLRISRRRYLPRKIFGHAAKHHALPRFAVLEGAHGGSYRFQKCVARVLGKLESRAFLDGIIQPAGGANHRHRAVMQAVDLVQPAGFVTAGHQENVRPGLDAVRQSVVETDACGNSPGMFLLHRSEERRVGKECRSR